LPLTAECDENAHEEMSPSPDPARRGRKKDASGGGLYSGFRVRVKDFRVLRV